MFPGVPGREPTAQGTVDRTPAVHLLVYVFERVLSGTLVFFDDRTVTEVGIVGGVASRARTTAKAVHLGDVLGELGFVDLQLLRASQEIAASEGRLHGQWLIEHGHLTHAQLSEALKVQLARKIDCVFAYGESARYAYYDNLDLLDGWGERDSQRADPYAMVWRGLQKAPPWGHVRAALERLGQGRLKLSAHTELDRFAFGADETKLLPFLSSTGRTFTDLRAVAAVPPRDTDLLVYALLITKQVEVINAEKTASGRVAAVAPVRPVSTDQMRAVTPSSARLPVANPLTTPSSAKFPAVRPTTISGAPVPLPAAPRAEFARNMSPSPRTYSSRPPLPPDLEALRKEITGRAASIQTHTYYQMLGVDENATDPTIQKAYLALAKRWHPDKLPPELSYIKNECSKVFSHISEAYQTLSNQKKRQEYAVLMRHGQASPQAQMEAQGALEAAMIFQKIEPLLKRADYKAAEEIARRAYELDPGQGEYLAAVAWLEALKPENQDVPETQKCIAKLDKAIQLSERCERAFFYRAMLYKRIGDANSAFRDFKKSASINPGNMDAVREVRLFNMRGGKGSSLPPRKDSLTPAPPATTKGGLFGKLFKK